MLRRFEYEYEYEYRCAEYEYDPPENGFAPFLLVLALLLVLVPNTAPLNAARCSGVSSTTSAGKRY